ncbi:hypothetical protein [Streptomyces sp. NBC_01422]|uniref:hypothetical protein n=1 Tax=Streptomyces sp. NBC_01422 TaxID=2903859 RepID=UPI002E2C61BE|nr:hypothetical protein [Streptomyces sp. NBC_01422]
MPSTSVVAARLPGGRLLIAILDPAVPDHHSPLRHHLRNETPNSRQGLKGPGNGKLSVQASTPGEDPGEEQPGQTRIRTPR